MAKYQLVIKDISRKLDLEHAKLRSTCEKLLRHVADDEQASELLSTASTDVWCDDALVKRIQAHLGEAKFRAYVNALQDLAQCIISLREELGLKDFVSWFIRLVITNADLVM